MGNLKQFHQGLRSTKTKPAPKTKPTDVPISTPLQEISSKEIHLWEGHVRKLYSENTVRFPVCSRSGEKYIMITYHCDSNCTPQAIFSCRDDKHRFPAYNSIMKRLAAKGLIFDLQILDNEASA